MCFEFRNIIYLESSANEKETVKLIQMKLSCRKAWDQRLIRHELKKDLLCVVVVVVVVAFVVVVGTVATSLFGSIAPRKEHFKQLKFSNQAFLSPCSI